MEDPRELAKRLAREAKERMSASQPATPSRTMSAKEALAAAREAERKTALRPPQQRPSPTNAPQRPQQRKGAPSQQRRAPFEHPFEGAEVGAARFASHIEALRAVWRSHHARALQSGDAVLALTTIRMLSDLERLGETGIAAAKMHWKGEDWAVWYDATSGELLAVLPQADVYLAGVSR